MSISNTHSNNTTSIHVSALSSTSQSTHLKLLDLLDVEEAEYELLKNIDQTLNACRYYSPISLPTQNNSFGPSNTFRLLSHNVRSLVKNGETFKDFLHNAGMQLSAILVNETWLRDGVPVTNIPNYTYCGKNREGKSGGGVGIFINNANHFTARSDLVSTNPAMECISVEIDRGKNKNVVICCIYRPPDADFHGFINCLQALLNKIRLNDKISFIAGDFNLNVLDYSNDGPTTQFIDLMVSHNFFPTISKPTRLGATSNTLLDCIFTNSLAPATSGVILEFGISDHLPILLSTDLPDEEKRIHSSFNSRRNITPENVAGFNNWLTAAFADFRTIDSPDMALQNLISTIHSGIDQFLPIIKQNRKTAALKPWISRGILTSINTKNLLYKHYLKHKTPQNLAGFNTYKNCLTTIIRKAKKTYYQYLLTKNKGDSKKTWKVLKEIVGTRKTYSTCIKQLSIASTPVSDDRGVANALNEFFTTIGPNLEQSLPNSIIDPITYIQDDMPSTCFFHPVSSESIKIF